MENRMTILRAIAVLTALLTSFSTFAQTDLMSDILNATGSAASARFSSTGVVAGLNLSGNPDSKMNQYHVGVTTVIGLPLGLAIQPAILYNVKGSTIKGAIKGADLSTSVGYLELPVQIQWGVNIKKFRPYVFGEPFVGYGVNAKNVLHYREAVQGLVGTLVTEEGKIEEIKGDLTSRLEYGFSAGAGLQFGIVQLSAKMFWNLGNLYNEEGKLEDVRQSITSAIKDTRRVSGCAISLAILL